MCAHFPLFSPFREYVKRLNPALTIKTYVIALSKEIKQKNYAHIEHIVLLHTPCTVIILGFRCHCFDYRWRLEHCWIITEKKLGSRLQKAKCELGAMFFFRLSFRFPMDCEKYITAKPNKEKTQYIKRSGGIKFRDGIIHNSNNNNKNHKKASRM